MPIITRTACFFATLALASCLLAACASVPTSGRGDNAHVAHLRDVSNRQALARNHEITQGFDALNRRTSRSWEGGATQRWSFDGNGNVTREETPNGAEILSSYDVLNRRAKERDTQDFLKLADLNARSAPKNGVLATNLLAISDKHQRAQTPAASTMLWLVRSQESLKPPRVADAFHPFLLDLYCLCHHGFDAADDAPIR